MEVSILNGYKIKDKKATRFYDTVQDMKEDDTLKEGMHVKTKGYYSVNDGGASEYHIIATQSVSNHQEELENGLYATLIINDYINVKQLGAKGDGESDDTNAINKALENYKKVLIPTGTFMIRANNGNIIIDYPNFNGGLVLNDDTHLINKGILQCITNDYYYYQVINIIGDNVTIEGGKIYGDKLTHTGTEDSEFGYCVNLLSAKNTIIKNCEIAYGWGDSIAISSLESDNPINNCKNVTIDNCILHDSRRQGISIIAGNDVIVNNCEIYNISGIAPQSGIDIESNYPDDNPVKNVLINNCFIHDTVNASIITTAKCENVKVENSTINDSFNVNGKNIVYDNCSIDNINSGSASGTTFNNSIIGTGSTYSEGKLYFNNCITNGRFTTESNSNFQEIHFNNCTLNFLNSSYEQMFIVRAYHKLFINNCILNFDKALGTVYAELIQVENSILNPQSNALDGFFSKHIIFKNNVVNNYKLYRVCALQNGTEPSYVTNNIFKFKPDTIFGGSSSQYLFITNNITPTAITPGTFDHVIAINNYNNSSTEV